MTISTPRTPSSIAAAVLCRGWERSLAENKVMPPALTTTGRSRVMPTLPTVAGTLSSARHSALQDLGTLPGTTRSYANSINDSGQVVGVAYTPGGDERAFLYGGSGPLRYLGTLGGTQSYAEDINASGIIVGDSYTADGQRHAFLSDGGAMVDLNLLVDPASGWTLYGAFAINDAGQILSGAYNTAGVWQPVLLTPVPEPSTLAFLGTGAISVFAYAWRRRLLGVKDSRWFYQGDDGAFPRGWPSSASGNRNLIVAVLIKRPSSGMGFGPGFRRVGHIDHRSKTASTCGNPSPPAARFVSPFVLFVPFVDPSPPFRVFVLSRSRDPPPSLSQPQTTPPPSRSPPPSSFIIPPSSFTIPPGPKTTLAPARPICYTYRH